MNWNNDESIIFFKSREYRLCLVQLIEALMKIGKATSSGRQAQKLIDYFHHFF
jgi:hypothetical protein